MTRRHVKQDVWSELEATDRRVEAIERLLASGQIAEQAGATTSYIPSWTSTGTQPSIGDGTLIGSYCRIGDLVFFTVALTLGSTSSPGTGVWSFGLPYAPASGQRWTGQLDVLDAGVQHYAGWWTISAAAGGFEELLWASTAQTGTNVQATSPITFGNLDRLTITGHYGAA